MKKLLLIGLTLLLIVACSKKKDQATDEELTSAYSVTTMDEVADTLDYAPEESMDNAQNDVIEDTKTTSVTQEKTKKESNSAVKTSDKKQLKGEEPEIEYGDFTVQLISLKDKNRVEKLRKKLLTPSNKRGTYYTDIEEAVVNNETTYRLRLSGSYSSKYARYLGEKITSEFYEFNEFWIVKR
ncbi:MAG: SPOR domain-containing protein [Candidatus Cloacimonetes bacterium]|jgi:uncharacterized protein YcfL|nr:SPOR domain-containing protein [Candidatus Cloacimonadota bacterium]MDD4156442.1 SPOR domain-containing protein [Candidatus Cloacimonadota bacterium]